MECSGALPTTQFAYSKGFLTCDSPMCVYHTLHIALERGGQVPKIVYIDFSAAFDTVSYVRAFSSSYALHA